MIQAPEPCRICGGALAFAFEIKVMKHHLAPFHLCQDCRSLVVPSPSWLEESYATTLVPDPDQGALARTAFIHRCIRRMRASSIGLIPKRCRTLEFGAGRGFLLRMLLDEGKDAWGFDPYPIAVLGEDRVATQLPEGAFDLITAIEVLEHTLDPIPALRRLEEKLEPNGLLLVSTELFDETKHGADWIYLAPEHGQHITLFSAKGLHRATTQAGLRWAASLDWGGIPFAHLLVKSHCPVSRLKAWRLQRRHAQGEKRLRRDENI